MSTSTLAGLLLIAVPLAFNALVVLLSRAIPDADGTLLALATPLGVLGIVIGPVLVLCSLEFVGSKEPSGWKLAELVTPFAYIAWSLWLIATGVALVV